MPCRDESETIPVLTSTGLLLANSRAAVADGATPLLPEPRWTLPTNSPQDDDARYADWATALSSHERISAVVGWGLIV
jgi:hypothetical protein